MNLKVVPCPYEKKLTFHPRFCMAALRLGLGLELGLGFLRSQFAKNPRFDVGVS